MIKEFFTSKDLMLDEFELNSIDDWYMTHNNGICNSVRGPVSIEFNYDGVIIAKCKCCNEEYIVRP